MQMLRLSIIIDLVTSELFWHMHFILEKTHLFILNILTLVKILK